MRTFPVLALLTIAIPFVGPAAAQDKTWVGKAILVKKAGIKIGHTGPDGKQVYLATLGLADYQVIAEESDWIRVKAGNGAVGWFDKADAVLLEDAGAYFTGRIKANPSDALAYYLRGFARLRQNDVDGASAITAKRSGSSLPTKSVPSVESCGPARGTTTRPSSISTPL